MYLVNQYGEDGNGLWYGFLKKFQDVNFSKVQVSLENRWMFEKGSCSVDFIPEIAFTHLFSQS